MGDLSRNQRMEQSFAHAHLVEGLQGQQLLALPAQGSFVGVAEEPHIQPLISRQEVQLGAIDHKLRG